MDKDKQVVLQIRLSELERRFIKTVAAKRGMPIGKLMVELFRLEGERIAKAIADSEA